MMLEQDNQSDENEYSAPFLEDDCKPMIDRNELRFLWKLALAVLSSNMAALFYRELGMTEFYNERLKDETRNYILQFPDDWEAMLPEGYLNHISKIIGIDTRNAIEEWHINTVPHHDIYVLFTKWISGFSYLVDAWDDLDALDQPIPYNAPEETYIRIKVRAFLLYSSCIDKELTRAWAAPRSEWDDAMGTELRTEIGLGINNQRTRTFLKELVQCSSIQQLERLLDWTRKLAAEGHIAPTYLPEL